jgi:hypothetical protein
VIAWTSGSSCASACRIAARIWPRRSSVEPDVPDGDGDALAERGGQVRAQRPDQAGGHLDGALAGLAVLDLDQRAVHVADAEGLDRDLAREEDLEPAVRVARLVVQPRDAAVAVQRRPIASATS